MMTDDTLQQALRIIGDYLRRRREELGLTQTDVARRAGISLRTVQRVESADSWIGLKQFLQICEVLHLFPTVVEMESDTEIAKALRSAWKLNPKAMSIEEAIARKNSRYKRPDEHN